MICTSNVLWTSIPAKAMTIAPPRSMRCSRAMAWRGLPSVDYPSVTRFLAATPSRLLVVTIEDVLGLVEQVNVPGTVDEHPNWRRRLPVELEGYANSLAPIAAIMTESGRRTGTPP